MRLTRRTVLAIAYLLAAFGQATGQEPKIASDVTAIDVLLAPDDVMLEHAKAANARLRADYPQGFALDATHAPHITIIQRFVRTSDLDKVYAAVAKVLAEENPTAWELKATGYYDIPVEKLGLAGIVIEPTQDLLRLQQKLIDAVAPFNSDQGTAEAFALRLDGKTISQAQQTIDYVTEFVPKSSGKNYNPHVTIGLGTREFVNKLKAEPFQPFTFKARAVDVYQLGGFGTAQKLLWTSAAADPLPSWSEGPVKKSITDFVAKVTKEGGPDYVPVAERIALFDNDGTLWCEQPLPVQLYFAVDRIPPEQAVGSSIKVQYLVRDGKPALVRLPELEFNDDKAGKPVGIHKFIGRRPLMACGNSDGDFEMIEWTTTGSGPRFGLIVQHTDADREYAYDRKAGLGRLDRGLDEAPKRGWGVVSMKNDWKRAFPFEKKRL